MPCTISQDRHASPNLFEDGPPRPRLEAGTNDLSVRGVCMTLELLFRLAQPCRDRSRLLLRIARWKLECTVDETVR